MSRDYGYFRPPKTHSSNAHAQPSGGARCQIFGRTLRLLPFFSVQTAKALARLRGCVGSPEPSLVAYVKYHNLMSCLNLARSEQYSSFKLNYWPVTMIIQICLS